MYREDIHVPKQTRSMPRNSGRLRLLWVYLPHFLSRSITLLYTLPWSLWKHLPTSTFVWNINFQANTVEIIKQILGTGRRQIYQQKKKYWTRSLTLLKAIKDKHDNTIRDSWACFYNWAHSLKFLYIYINVCQCWEHTHSWKNFSTKLSLTQPTTCPWCSPILYCQPGTFPGYASINIICHPSLFRGRSRKEVQLNS